VAAKPSKFTGIFDTPQDAEREAVPVADTLTLNQPFETPTPSITALSPATEAGRGEPQRTGRPANGKKSDPNYRQVTAYVRKDLYRNVTDALYDEARGRETKRKEFSELVDELLDLWWQEQQTQNH